MAIHNYYSPEIQLINKIMEDTTISLLVAAALGWIVGYIVGGIVGIAIGRHSNNK